MHKSPRGRRARGGSRSDVWPCGVESITGYHKAVILPTFGREPGQLNYLLKAGAPPQLLEPHEEGAVGGEGCRAPFRTFPLHAVRSQWLQGPADQPLRGEMFHSTAVYHFAKPFPLSVPLTRQTRSSTGGHRAREESGTHPGTQAVTEEKGGLDSGIAFVCLGFFL